MPTTALNMEGLHHCSLGQPHFSSNVKVTDGLALSCSKAANWGNTSAAAFGKGYLYRPWIWQERGTLQLPKAGAGNCREGDSTSLKLHYVCWQRQLLCQCPPESDPWQTPRRGVTDTAGAKGHVLLGVLSGVAGLAPHIPATGWGGLLAAHL